ncbi:MAG: cob(I)yrinic acid a,c-diamide adenosyltransferase [Cyanobacteriota bacterium]|nr:cob(I)yrinic acid a,c-diamide adenosyltransferase [Cyanobacteriota bacterium]
MTARLAHPGPHQRNEAPSVSLRLLQSPSLQLASQPEGLLQIHTAPHRGSFSGVLSQALRAAGLGSRVLVCQLLKGGVGQGVKGSQMLCGRLQWLRPATPRCLETSAEHLVEDPEESGGVRQAVREIWLYSRDQLLRERVDQLVLDELGLAIELGYVPLAEVLDTLEKRPPHLDVIVTGPAIPEALMAMADQVTELRRVL